MNLIKSLRNLLLLSCLVSTPVAAPTPVAVAAQEETEPASFSKLAIIKLPRGAERIKENSVPASLNDTLAALLKVAGPGVRQGKNEVLAWRGNAYKKSQAPQMMKQMQDELQGVGWAVEAPQSDENMTMWAVSRSEPEPRALIGVWVHTDEALILGWTEMLAAGAAPAADNNGEDTANTNNAGAEDEPQPTRPVGSTKAPATPAGTVTVTLDATTKVVNVMKKAMPKIPAFPELEPKVGYVRGYVKDTKGNPLQNAKLGVRSTAIGGAYSGAQGKTDAKGYYEIAVPFGVAHFYNAGYSIDYGEGRLAMGLHPADGELDSFASNVGGVENFVLLAYGIGDPDDVQDNPQYSNNYYGGAVTLSWNVADDNPVWANAADLPANATIELTLTPQEALIDGSQGQTIVIRKNTGTWFNQLYIVNIPVTTYRISAKLAGGGALKMKETGPNGGTAFGIDPKEATGTATLQLRPDSAKAESALPAHGNWDGISLSLSR